MAITIPSDLELLAANELGGYMSADNGRDALHTLMRRTNWHYATHAPALTNFAPACIQGTSNQVVVPVTPSADGLTYTAHFAVWAEKKGSVDINLEESASYGSGYSSVSSFPHTTASIDALAVGTFSYDAVIASSTNYLRITVDNGKGVVQLQAVLVHPKKITSISAGEKSSGFIAYDDAALTVAGAPVHTEYFQRLQDSIRATTADRIHCVWSWVQPATPVRHLFTAGGYGDRDTWIIGLTGFELPVKTSETLNVYSCCQDTGTNGDIVVEQVGSSKAAAVMTASNTPETATIEIDPSAPMVLMATAVNPGATMSVRYIIVEWVPSIGTPIPIIGSPAPPPLRSYLQSADALSREACLRPYAGTGVCIDADNASSTYWYHFAHVSPGVQALQQMVTISRNNANTAGSPAAFFENGVGQQINVESPLGGTPVYPPLDYAQVVDGSTNYVPSPVATWQRMINVTADREPTTITLYSRYHAGMGTRSYRVVPPSALP